VVPVPARQRSGRLLTVLAVALALLSASHAQEPYRRMLDQPLGFTGPESQAAELSALDEIRIGLYVPDQPGHPVGQAVTRGATLAVEQANAAGGYQGVPFRLVRRWAEDPWSGGAREVVRLVYEDRVWALIGSVDGASSHVAQQVVTKAHLPMIAPVSSDPSLTHARVPWIFRLAPDDQVQAQVLVAELVRLHLTRVGVVTTGEHDSYTAATELVKEMARQGTAPAFQLQAPPAGGEPDDLVRRIIAFKPDGLVVRLAPAATVRLIEAMGKAGLGCPVLLPWVPGADPTRLSPSYPGSVAALEPFHRPQQCGPYLKLVHAYTRRFGEYPLPSAAYGYDAAMLIIEAIRNGGLQRRAIRDHLAALSGYPGATGTITWDNGGGNTGRPVVAGFAAPPNPAPPGW
jgi:ABC-type branched-subunit amino acid transport system substrate-binding protein